jgi:hypothetical protein
LVGFLNPGRILLCKKQKTPHQKDDSPFGLPVVPFGGYDPTKSAPDEEVAILVGSLYCTMLTVSKRNTMSLGIVVELP